MDRHPPTALILIGTLALFSAQVGGSEESPPPIKPPAPSKPASTAAVERDAQWPQWRGPLATGVGPLAEPPVRWSETENVVFKVEPPGHGHATPVLWGDHLFLTAAIPVGEPFEPVYAEAPGAHDNAPVSRRHAFAVMAIDRWTGEVAWQRTVRDEIPWQGMHRSGSYASPSPVTDGGVLIASFGSQGLYAFDLAGEELWSRDLGDLKIKHAHGEGGGPALHGDTVVVVWDHEGPSFLIALDKTTGEERWRVPRSQGTSWSTPIVVERSGGPQVVVAGTDQLRGHDLATGKELWRVSGLSANVVASPVSDGRRVFAGSSYEHQIFFAIDLEGARGDLTGTEHVLWRRSRGTPYVPSPLLYDGHLYFHNHYQSVLTRVAAEDGAERPGPFRLPGIRNVYGSPVAAAGRVYVTDLEGTTLVLRHADPPQILARNRLDDRFSASAVLAGRDLYLRGERFLYRIADRSGRQPQER
ncbi:MAG: PQQ-binding-like beta-propeller repeat protein [Acidobacteriota bacterium]